MNYLNIQNYAVNRMQRPTSTRFTLASLVAMLLGLCTQSYAAEPFQIAQAGRRSACFQTPTGQVCRPCEATPSGTVCPIPPGANQLLPDVIDSGSGFRSIPTPSPTTSQAPTASPQEALPRIIRVAGPGQFVRSIVISPDGKMIASGDDRGNLKLWDLSTGNLVKTIVASTSAEWDGNRIQAVVFSPDGKFIACSGGADGRLQIWTLDGTLISTMSSRERVYSLAYSPDGKLLISGHRSGIIKLWDARSGKLLSSINDRSGTITSIAMSPDGQTFASGNKVWNLSGTLIRTLLNSGGSGGVNSIDISPDGRIVAGYSVIDKEAVSLWNLQTGQVISTLDVGIERPHAVVFSPDGKTLAIGGFADQIQIWDISTRSKLRTLTSGISGYQTYSLDFSRDGKTIVSGGADGSGGIIVIWSTSGSSTDTK